ncbi:uncharacterized protein V6R79_004297 [Siganus canaliculatus]
MKESCRRSAGRLTDDKRTTDGRPASGFCRLNKHGDGRSVRIQKQTHGMVRLCWILLLPFVPCCQRYCGSGRWIPVCVFKRCLRLFSGAVVWQSSDAAVTLHAAARRGERN